jgi:hypothetical protein
LVGIVALADVATWVQTLSLGRTAACEALAATLAAISQPPSEPAEPAAAAE